MSTRCLHQIFHNRDLYEIVVNGHTILRIARYAHESRSRDDLQFDQLPKEVKDQLVKEIVEREREDDGP